MHYIFIFIIIIYLKNQKFTLKETKNRKIIIISHKSIALEWMGYATD